MAYSGYPPQGGYQGGGYPGGGYPSGSYPSGAYPAGSQGGAGFYGGPRQYYFIKSRLNGLVLDVEGNNRNPGARVLTWHKKNTDHDNQLWYDDPSTGTIRSKLNDFCLDVEGGILVLKPFQPGDPNQQWMRTDTVIRNRMNQNKCLDISGVKKDPGATLCSWDHNGGPNQQFDYEFHDYGGAPVPSGGAGYYAGQPGYPPTGSYTARREFLIVSDMNGKVMDVERANASPGASVIMFKKKTPPGRNQLWYVDQQGIIRSALNDFALQSRGSGHQLKMHPFNGGQDQMWSFQGQKIANPSGECLDIKGASHHDGADVIVYSYKGSNNQHWRAEYV